MNVLPWLGIEAVCSNEFELEIMLAPVQNAPVGSLVAHVVFTIYNIYSQVTQ